MKFTGMLTAEEARAIWDALPEWQLDYPWIAYVDGKPFDTIRPSLVMGWRTYVAGSGVEYIPAPGLAIDMSVTPPADRPIILEYQHHGAILSASARQEVDNEDGQAWWVEDFSHIRLTPVIGGTAIGWTPRVVVED